MRVAVQNLHPESTLIEKVIVSFISALIIIIRFCLVLFPSHFSFF